MHSVRYPANGTLSRLFACQPEVNGCQRVGLDKVDTLSSPLMPRKRTPFSVIIANSGM